MRAAGFENVTVDNATYFNVPSTRVSYYHEENSAEAEELGDLLFSAVNAARFLKADPEDALNAATDKFIRRFQQVEAQAAQAGRAMENMTLAELDKLWENAKRT